MHIFRPAISKTSLAAACGQMTEIGIGGCLFAAPLFAGGRTAFGQMVYVLLVAATAAAWTANRMLGSRQSLPATKAYWILLAGVGVSILQLVPLPANWLGTLSPALSELLPTWSNSSESVLRLGEWNTVSLYPSATKLGLALLLAHGTLLTMLIDRLRTRGDIHRLITGIAAATVVMATLGLLSLATGGTKLLWIYDYPYLPASHAARGAFTNPNHFGHFLALGIGAIIYQTVHAFQAIADQSTKRTKSQVQASRKLRMIAAGWSFGLVISLGGILLSYSLGAGISLMLVLLCVFVLLLKSGKLQRDHAFKVAVIGCVLIALLSLTSYERFAAQVGGLSSETLTDFEATHGRTEIWQANFAALKASPWLGFGIGTHQELYHAFFTGTAANEFTHAESGYLQIASETGIAGLLVLTAAIGLALVWCGRGVFGSQGNDLLWVAIAPAILISVVHSVGDFVWYLPGCLAVTIALSACAFRLQQAAVNEETGSQTTTSWGRYAPGMAMMAVSWAAAVFLPTGIASLSNDDYSRASIANRNFTANLALQSGEDKQQKALETSRYYSEVMIRALEASLSQDHLNARTYMQLASQQLHLFELRQVDAPNAMDLQSLASTALASEFASRAKMIAWLQRAFGDNANLLIAAHANTRRAIQLCPLQGSAYLDLADLSFLSPPSQRDATSLVNQAVKLRPRRGAVLYGAGRLCYHLRQQEKAIEYWRTCASLPGAHRKKLVELFCRYISAGDFIEEFKPDWKLLHSAYQKYRLQERPEDLQAIVTYAQQLADEGEALNNPALCAFRWQLVAQVQLELEDFEAAVQSAERALELYPSHLHIRLSVARAYFLAEQFDKASPHIRWCLSRRPDIKYLHDWLKIAAKRQDLDSRPGSLSLAMRNSDTLPEEESIVSGQSETESTANQPNDQPASGTSTKPLDNRDE